MKHIYNYKHFLNENKSNLNDNFWKWFGDSKIIENNKPKILYHGSNENFYIFDINKIGYGSGNYGHYGYGFYFSDDIREAKTYGNNILECYLKITNPFTGSNDQILLLKNAGVGNIDDLIDLSIDLESLINEIKKIDIKLSEFLLNINEFGIEKGWEIFIKNNKKYIEINSDILNDLTDIINYTTFNKHADGVADYVYDILNNIGIKKQNLKINKGFKYHQSLHWITDLGNLSKKVTDEIIKLGFDGIIYGSEYITLYPNQIKSIENDGSWDIYDENIYS